ncbi:uncharacterized protein [Oscarella lobularis]|uniref:uncharacterized protein n=1 Tax=Oscarella lobularis TaxID=121494 RepID=UPI00331436E2
MQSLGAHRRYQIGVFMLAWGSYAAVYLLRKPLSLVKKDMQAEMGLSTSQLGWMDTAFIFPYALAQMMLGGSADKLGARLTMGSCMLLSAASMFSFGYWNIFPLLLFLLFLNGISQSLIWASTVKGIVAWFPGDEQSTVLGLLGTSAFVGGIVAAATAVRLQMIGWRHCFALPSAVVGLLGLLVLWLFRPPPSKHEFNSDIDLKSKREIRQGSAPGLTQIFSIRGMTETALACFGTKAVRYTMLMWLPMYLYEELEYKEVQAGLLSTVFDVGGVAGSVSLGYIADKFFNSQSILCTTFSLLGSTVAFLLFLYTSTFGMTFNILFLFLAGFTNCGSDTMITGPIAAQLGKQDGRNMQGSVIGFINGFGTAGAILEGPTIGFIASQFGWKSVFYVMFTVALLSALSLTRAQSKSPKTITK